MFIRYRGAFKLKGNLLFFKTIEGIKYGERVFINIDDRRINGKVVQIEEKVTLIEIMGETSTINPEKVRVEFTGKPFDIPVSEKMLGRILNAFGEPVDNMGDILPDKYMEITGNAYNPALREQPREYIQTGISAIDGLNTLVKGQKLPIFAVSGVPTDDLVAQVVRQLQSGKTATIFAAIGLRYETINSMIEEIISGGNFSTTAIFVSSAQEPPINKILLPRSALTFAEYLSFEKGYDVIVVLYDMTNYCDALREVSTKRGEIPSRKGYPGYMYSDLATIYERAGIIKGKEGSLTQIPVLTMPDDDITHPIPDLTGYITEGQIVLDREIHQRGIYPPINVLPSLSRLMNKGTTKLHQRWAHQMYASYTKTKRIQMLASIIGESEISPVERLYLKFGERFEKEFLKQGKYENRTLEETMEIGWNILKILPEEELTRLKEEDIKSFIKKENGSN